MFRALKLFPLVTPEPACDEVRHRVVVVGGGFGGLQAALALRRAAVDVTLVDRRNFHLFQPLTYQVATGALSPGEIACPLRAIFKRDRNVRVVMAEVTDFDLDGEVCLRGVAGTPAPESLSYDTLIVAGGSRYSYFGHDDWSELAGEVKSLESALAVRGRLSQRLRGRRARAGLGPARGMADVCRRGRRSDRGGDGRPDRRARA
jgi:NADH:ubiquinone reductase (H+-translocating)